MTFWSLDDDHGLQRLQEFLGSNGLGIALTLNRKFVRIHGIRNVDCDNQLDINGWHAVLGVGKARRGYCRGLTPAIVPATSTATKMNRRMAILRSSSSYYPV